ncbi:MAG: Rho termination factor N-terminal domain-containing protein, partial [Muribaculaceae bacterium]|nr:Rho termination factor N-terminal domain-containing protein [Muribaculaceae bacterium]
MLTLEELETWDDARLHKAAEEYGMTNPASAGRQDVIFHIIDNQAISTAKEVVNSTRKRKGKQAAAEEAAASEPQPKKRGRKPKAKASDETNDDNASAPKEDKP